MILEQHRFTGWTPQDLNFPSDVGHHVAELLGLSVHAGFRFVNKALTF